MSEMKIHNLWPINVGEFHNPEHQTIKKDLMYWFVIDDLVNQYYQLTN